VAALDHREGRGLRGAAAADVVVLARPAPADDVPRARSA